MHRSVLYIHCFQADRPQRRGGPSAYLQDRGCQVDKPGRENRSHADGYEVRQQLSLLSSHCFAEGRNTSREQADDYVLCMKEKLALWCCSSIYLMRLLAML